MLAWRAGTLFSGTPDETVAFYRELHSAGFQYFIANILAEDLDTIDLMTMHLVPAFA